MFCLIKFGTKEHMESLLNVGEIHFSPLINFYNSTEEERGDSNEGLIKLENVKIKEVKVEHPTLGTYVFKMDETSNSKMKTFIDEPYLCFSAYAITNRTFETSNEYTIDENMQKLGKYAVIINEPLKFINMVVTNLKQQGLFVGEGMVDYLNYSNREKYDLTFFNKSEEFKHQAEYRIIIRVPELESKQIHIGSIKNCANICKTEEFINTKWTI